MITEPAATIAEPAVTITAEEEFELQLSREILDLLLSPADWIRMEFEIKGGNQTAKHDRLWAKYLREKDTLLMERPEIKSGSGREAIT